MWSALGVSALGGLAAWSTLIEPFWIRPVTYEVPWAGLDPALDGFTFLHLSDLHGRVEVFSSPLFDRWLAGADAVAVTGDLFAPTLPRRRVVERLVRLSRRIPLFYCSGNHDYRRGSLAIEPWSPGDARLDNRAVKISRNTGHLWLAGLPDLVKGHPLPLSRLATSLPGGEPAVLLCHRPDGALLEGASRFGLILSGHTHGGQVVIPGWGAPVKHNRVGQGYAGGWRMLSESTVLITSRGLGTSELPVRFCCRPELVRVVLKSRK